MDLSQVLVSLISGAVGGNVAGAAVPEDKSLGAVGNTVTGLLGGGASGYLLQALGLFAQAGLTGASAMSPEHAASGFDIGSILANVGTSGVGGAILSAVVGWLKSSLQK